MQYSIMIWSAHNDYETEHIANKSIICLKHFKHNSIFAYHHFLPNRLNYHKISYKATFKRLATRNIACCNNNNLSKLDYLLTLFMVHVRAPLISLYAFVIVQGWNVGYESLACKNKFDNHDNKVKPAKRYCIIPIFRVCNLS